MKKFIILIAAASSVVSCSAPLKFPDEAYSTRASFDINRVIGKSPQSFRQETSPEICGVVHEAIRRDMLDVGSHPKRAIVDSDLISLISVTPNSSTGDSRVNYRAIVRLNFDRHTIDQEYLVFERDGDIIVRRIST